MLLTFREGFNYDFQINVKFSLKYKFVHTEGYGGYIQDKFVQLNQMAKDEN